jgi:hypothetical protein
MYAGFLIGHGWRGGVLLDSDDANASSVDSRAGRTAIENFRDDIGARRWSLDALWIKDLLP